MKAPSRRAAFREASGRPRVTLRTISIPRRGILTTGFPMPGFPAIAVLVAGLLGLAPTTTFAQSTDTTRAAPPAPQDAGGDDALSHPVQANARDSLVIVFDETDGDVGSLVGDVRITYGETKLNAHQVDILFSIDELRAHGLPSDTGLVGRPTFEQGSETFVGDQMAFNLRTERGRVVGAQTQYEEGYIRGGVVKLREDSTLFIRNGIYTTCECADDPSYSLRSNKMKVVDQEWIYTGPIQLFLFNIPTPLWLPFGFLPAQQARHGGFIPPQYGEDELGFYLRDMGWYFAMNEYMDLQLQGGLWTSGSWQSSATYRYNRRYRYRGQLRVDYALQRTGERDDPDFAKRRTSSLRWNHNQNLDPSTSFSSDVNLSTAGYLRTISENYDDRVSQTISSNIRFSKNWATTNRSLNLSLSQRQVLDTDAASLTIPSLSFSQSGRKPFQRSTRAPGQREQWYERITYSYTLNVDNRFDFTPLSDEQLFARGDTAAASFTWYDALVSREKYRRATGDEEPFDFKATNRIPVSASFSLDRLSLNVTPNLSYSEDWFISTTRRSIVPTTDSTSALVTRQVPGFFALRQFSSGVSANTTVYGIFPVRLGSIDGIRHTVRPSLSFTFRPDYFADFWGYTRSYVDANGREQEYAIVNGVSSGLQQALSLSLSNVFEAKQVAVDSTGEERSNVLKLLNADLSTSYNFAADSLRLSNISLSARTNVIDNVSINFSSTFSPYRLNDAETRMIDKYVFTGTNFRLARLTRINLTASTSFQSKRGTPGRPVAQTPGAYNPDQFGDEVDPFDPIDPLTPQYDTYGDEYADFNIPWSLSLDMTYGINRPLGVVNRTLTLNSRFDFNLTPNWKVQGRTGYDFERKEFVTTTINIHRDLECWTMSVSWTPFGRYQSYGFTLQVKSGQLRNLLRIQQPRQDVRNRFSNLL